MSQITPKPSGNILDFFVGTRYKDTEYYITDIIECGKFYYQIKSDDFLLQEIINCPVRILYKLPEKEV